MIQNRNHNDTLGIEIEISSEFDIGSIQIGKLGGKKNANCIRLPNGVYRIDGQKVTIAEVKVTDSELSPNWVNPFSIEKKFIGEIRDLDGHPLWRNPSFCSKCHLMKNSYCGTKSLYFCKLCKIIWIMSYFKEEANLQAFGENPDLSLQFIWQNEHAICPKCKTETGENYAIDIVCECQHCGNRRFIMEGSLN